MNGATNLPEKPTVDERLREIDLAYQAQRLHDAERLCVELIAQEPENAQAKLMHGFIVALRGDRLKAIEILNEAVALAPTFQEASLKLATLLYEVGRTNEAISVGSQFVKRAPKAWAVHNFLGVCHFDQGAFSEAADCFRRAVVLRPDQVKFRQNLAAALERRGNKAASNKLHQQAVAESANALDTGLRMGAFQLAQGKAKEAITTYQSVLQGAPHSYTANLQLAIARMQAGEPDEAVAAFQKAIELDPQRGEPVVGLGLAYQELGRFDDAIKCFEDALRLEPRRIALYLRIAASKKIGSADQPMVDRMRDLLKRDGLSYLDRRALHYALCKACDDLGDYENALRHADEATQITIDHPAPEDVPFDRAADQAKLEFTIKTFNQELLTAHRALSLDTELPVLIIGSPRSGTTLLDQILSGHPQIGSAGEQHFWNQNASAALEAIQRNSSKATEIATNYSDLLRSNGPLAKRVIDKMPTNYGATGLIHALLPNARFVHCRRHPVDTCISLYMNAHSMPVTPFGRSRADMVFGYKSYLRVMEHWRSILPADRFLEVDYEEVVANREDVARRIVDFCGLEWNDACLRHEANSRKVRTPSLWQVRQPIYTTSVERWRRYEPWLGEFRELL